MKPLVLRTAAAQAAVDRFLGRKFRWSSNDCARMAAFTLRKLGYVVELPKAGAYRTLEQAKAALADRGHDSLAAALDAMGLARIAPVAALPGDILGVPDEGGWTALWVAVGNGRALGYHADSLEACIVQPNFSPELIAWGAPPRG